MSIWKERRRERDREYVNCKNGLHCRLDISYRRKDQRELYNQEHQSDMEEFSTEHYLMFSSLHDSARYLPPLLMSIQSPCLTLQYFRYSCFYLVCASSASASAYVCTARTAQGIEDWHQTPLSWVGKMQHATYLCPSSLDFIILIYYLPMPLACCLPDRLSICLLCFFALPFYSQRTQTQSRHHCCLICNTTT